MHQVWPTTFSFEVAAVQGVSLISWKRNSLHALLHLFPHISKGPSDLKQNGTQEKTTFSGPVFHGLSCGVVRFVPTVSFWNHQIEASHWLKKGEFWPAITWNKMDRTTRKDTKNYNRNRCLFLGFHFVSDGSFGILFTTEEVCRNWFDLIADSKVGWVYFIYWHFRLHVRFERWVCMGLLV